MYDHVANVEDFQSALAAHSDWLIAAEQTMTSFKHPSKLVDRVCQQISEHKVGSTRAPWQRGGDSCL